MQPAERAELIGALLLQAQAAHGAYEATELNGVYDQQWPQWYAAYAVEHGLGSLLGHDVTADALAEFLASSYDDFERSDPKPSDSWAGYIARRMAAEAVSGMSSER
jgi:hypothetical protein